jgi:hypothetical protein
VGLGFNAVLLMRIDGGKGMVSMMKTYQYESGVILKYSSLYGSYSSINTLSPAVQKADHHQGCSDGDRSAG